MNFKIDENLPDDLADVLNAHGHSAVSVRTQGLHGKPDSDIAKVLERERYVFITLDRGFGDIRTYPPERFAGLIVLRAGKQDKTRLIDLLTRTIPLFDTEPLEGRLWIVESSRIRIWSDDSQ